MSAPTASNATGTPACPPQRTFALHEEHVLTWARASGTPRTGLNVRVQTYLGLSTEHELNLGITDRQGEVRFTPDEPGVLALIAGSDTLCEAHVPWPSPPPTVLAPLLAWALCAAFALWWARKHP